MNDTRRYCKACRCEVIERYRSVHYKTKKHMRNEKKIKIEKNSLFLFPVRENKKVKKKYNKLKFIFFENIIIHEEL